MIFVGLSGDNHDEPVPVVVRSKVCDYGRLPAGTAGSNPALDTVACLLCVVCCQVDVSASG